MNKVLINWRAYVDMHRGTQAFITQMVKMVGDEPLETSNGDVTLLPTYTVNHGMVALVIHIATTT